ncbi:MAG: type II toxin-antitoxin system VapC family toxin [Puniceicoccaceae bacterium]
MNRLLLDTGPIVALLDKADPAHERVRDSLPRTPVTLVTTCAVMTESMFFLQELPQGPEQLAGFMGASCVERVDIFAPAGLETCSRLMRTYADTPMDFADATLVLAATMLNLPDILTLDERGFRTYRFGRKQAFRLFLQDA